ncbi:MAG: hypothetical protein JO295_00575 [Verrucomicrobia bacterium]|nr:hypothetical protein [Verrucomicrobiota bacterium]
MNFQASTLTRRRFAIWFLTLVGLLPVGWLLAAQTNDSAATQLLASELPTGVTLANANADQMVAAVRSAVRSDPRMAPGVVRVAIITKVASANRRQRAPRTTPRRRPHESKDVAEQTVTFPSLGGSDFVFIAQISNQFDPCAYANRILRAAIAEAPGQARQLIEEATQLLPDCDFSGAGGGGGEGPGGGGISGGGDGFGFGFGFGPGFVGSPPGGVLALPPTGTEVSPTGNR